MNGMQVCLYIWTVFLVVWLALAIRVKPVQSRESVSSRLSYTILTVAGAFLMFSGEAPRSWLRFSLFAGTRWTDGLGIAITAAGVAFAIWARLYLGGNWSGSVTVKVGHQLVTSGPYRWVRHPIYSGMVLGLLGTALVRHEVRGLIAVVLLYVGFKIKSRIEERAMAGTFGTEYQEYSRTTGAILPRIRL